MPVCDVLEHFDGCTTLEECLNELLDSDKMQSLVGLSLEHSGDEIRYDSYGSECSHLERVFKYKDVLIKFTGSRCSYDGETWSKYEVVEKKQKTISTYE